MSVAAYWKERLLAVHPLFTEAMRVDGLHIKSKVGQQVQNAPCWPHSVARYSLYTDYCEWHNKVHLESYRNTPYYAEHPDRVPEPVSELMFFTTMSPWLYVVGKDQQVRSYLVPHQYQYEGEWVIGKKNSYFVRLLDWAVHVAAFELSTGLRVGDDAEFFDEARAKAVSEAKDRYLSKIAENRQALSASMGT